MKKVVALFAVLVACFVGCSSAPPTWVLSKTTKMDNIEVVFMNKPSDYTVFVRHKTDKNQLVAHGLFPSGHSASANERGEFKLFTDAGQTMWAEIKEYKASGSRNTKKDIDLHIHSKENLHGGQWQERQGKGHVEGRVQKVE